MRVCILGSSGMLGNAVAKEFINEKFFDVYITFNHNFYNDFELNKNNMIKFNALNDSDILKDYNFDVIINCIGIVKPRINSTSQETIAILVNSDKVILCILSIVLANLTSSAANVALEPICSS